MESHVEPNRLGKYRLERKIAVGGMAEVYLASDGGGRKFAIKIVLPGFAVERKFVQMFLDEASLISRFRHENIARLYDFGKADGTYFIAMEWIDGQVLADIVDAQLNTARPFPEDIALVLMRDVLRGLDYAHHQRDRFDRPLGVIHRDISPPNILVNREGVAKIIDFGVARARSKATQTQPGIIRGKFSYMSPEQSHGEEMDARSDLFSAGIVLYEVLSGQRLFLRETDLATIKAVRGDAVPPLSEYRPDLPQAIVNLVGKALQKDPGKRYALASDMARDIEKILSKEYGSPSREDVTRHLTSLFPHTDFESKAAATIPSQADRTFSEYSFVSPYPKRWRNFWAWGQKHPVLFGLGVGLGVLFLVELAYRLF